MIDRIRIGFFVHCWDYAGTAYDLEMTMKYIDREVFEPFAIVWQNRYSCRLEQIKDIVGPSHIINFTASLNKSGPELGYTPIESNFDEVVRSANLDIIHYTRGGYHEWPFNKRHAKLQIETNVFGYVDYSGFCDFSFFISDYVKKIHQSNKETSGVVSYIPVEMPVPYQEDLRAELKIKENTLVFGRIGRPGNFHPIGLKAYASIKPQFEYENIAYIIQNPPPECIQFVEQNNTQDVYFLPQTNDDKRLELFYNTIDVFAHFRADGECFGVGIAQAMLRGKPVITHQSNIYNAQEETVGDGGVYCTTEEQYAQAMKGLIVSRDYRLDVGKRAFKRAILFYGASKVVLLRQYFYLKLLQRIKDD